MSDSLGILNSASEHGEKSSIWVGQANEEKTGGAESD